MLCLSSAIKCCDSIELSREEDASAPVTKAELTELLSAMNVVQDQMEMECC